MGTKSDLGAHPVTPAVGAVISGVDLSEPLPPETVNFVRQTLFDRGVIFFQDQNITADQSWAFLKNFGTPQKDDSFGTDADRPDEIRDANFQLTRKATCVWHADSTFLAEPPKLTMLRAVKLPPSGGDTCWSSMVAAYEALSEPMRDMIDELSAVHSIEPPVARMRAYGNVFAAKFTAVHTPQQVHPVVQLHPETGRKALFVTESCTTRIVEFEPVESRHTLALLFEHIKSPNFNMRWRWTPNDVALWDNRIVQHYAVPDYHTERVMNRIVVAGDRPYGPGSARQADRLVKAAL